jgi:hypothetical protein
VHDRGSIDCATWKRRHFLWSSSGKAGTITLHRPERKNPLSFESISLATFDRDLGETAEARHIELATPVCPDI